MPFVLIAFLLLLYASPLFMPGKIIARADVERLVDDADLLTEEEESALRNKLDEMSNRLQFDVAIVTKYGLDGQDTVSYADDYYDGNGYGFGEEHDGCLLLIDMEEREYYTTTTGFGIDALTDYGLETLDEAFVDSLSNGEYARAFTDYADGVDELVTMARNGEIYDTNSAVDDAPSFVAEQEPDRSAPGVGAAAGAGAVGAAAAAAATGAQRSKLKTVHRQGGASQYYVKDSLQIDPSRSRDDFLYRNVTRVPIPRDRDGGGGGSSIHIGSSGISHGGHGGKF